MTIVRTCLSMLPWLLAIAGAVHAEPADQLPVKVRDLAHVQGVRDNPLVGYGII